MIKEQTPQRRALDDAFNTLVLYSKLSESRQDDMQSDFDSAIETIQQALQSAPEEIQVKDAYGISLLSSEDITDFILQYPNGIRIVKDKGE